MKPRYLTKSRFKVALECPTKLFYTGKKDIYADKKLEDPFLKALAQGGFQVGALAQCYYPEGITVASLDYEESLSETNELLKRDQVTIFEAAIRYKNLFVRVDILKKTGDKIELIEVKSKSIDPSTFENELWDQRRVKKGEYCLKGDWYDYIYDVAFQAFVAKIAFPTSIIQPFLMCADKSKIATVTGLNQKFRIKEINGRASVEITGQVKPEDLGDKILYSADVSFPVSKIHNAQEVGTDLGGSFDEFVFRFADAYERDEKIRPKVGAFCKKCEFRILEEGLKSGFNECWHQSIGMDNDELAKPFVFDVWNFRGADKLIESGIHLMEEITKDRFDIKDSDHLGLSSSERQWLQIEYSHSHDKKSYFIADGLKREMEGWKFPLHMIDFETCMVAIPFTAGMRPYEQIAFQFSHHLINENGEIFHFSEFISNKPGHFPNFDFVRALRSTLENDDGTIFRYSNHENTVLKQIKVQLQNSSEADKDSLIAFIDSITDESPRSMVDLCEMVKKYYYNPATNGSNSIKQVFPAILNESEFLKSKYSKPVYSSNNFKNKMWIQVDQAGKVIDPYKSLDPVFHEYDTEKIDTLMSEDATIGDGGAALTAYAMMQFTSMSEEERSRIRKALLRYCELDTLAMVMIWEHWNSILK